MEQKVGPLRVMLVDDHALVRSAVRQAITASDVELVGEAATAAEALALAPVLKPDILLLDIDLPGMNGVQLVQELAPRLPMTRIVMLTVSSSERDLIEAVGKGAAGYLTKDLSPEALHFGLDRLEQVEEFARGKREWLKANNRIDVTSLASELKTANSAELGRELITRVPQVVFEISPGAAV